MKYFNLFKSAISFLAIFLISANTFSQTATVDGYAFLENQTEHSGIKVKFLPNSPSAQLDSTYTNTDGSYNLSVELGVYYVNFYKMGYQTYFYTNGDAVVLSENETLADVTLIPGNIVYLSGNISGTLTPDNIYIVESDITIINGDVLTIEPGTTIKFGLDCNVHIFGLLYAMGTEDENILFTSTENNPNIGDWGKIQFNNFNSIFKYCKVEYGYEIRIEDSGATIENCEISYMYDAISCEQSDVIVRNNIIHHFSHTGIVIGSANIVIQDNIIVLNLIEDIDLKGITFSCSGNMIIENNIIYSPVDNNGYNSWGIWIPWNPSEGSYEISNNIIRNMKIGINLSPHGSTKVINNTIVNNSEIGVYVNMSSDHLVLLQSNIFTGNAIGIETHNENNFLEISYNNVWDNAVNFDSNIPAIGQIVTTNSNGDPSDTYFNISLNPLYADISNFDFHVMEGSPCIDAGINDSVSIEYDLDGNVRIWDGNNDGDAIVDMGVYEYGSIPYFPPTSTFTCPDNICVNDTAFIEYTGNATDTANYYWDFGGGIIIAGSGQGPYEVLWMESSEKIISLFVEENGMTSEITTQTINIIPLPTVYAGQDATIYAGESYLISDADAENYESLSWSTSGDGTFNDTLILHPVYYPGQNDIINGNVSLTLSGSSICGNESDDILLSIEHLSLSGSVLAGIDYLESGVVLIFDVNQSYYLPVQYTFVNNGNYSFEGLSLGNYIVYAIPNPFQVTGYFPTYYVNQLFWWNAVVIDLFGNAYDVDIHLVEIPDKAFGPGSINGVITYESPDVYEEEIYGNDWFGNSTGSPYGAWNMPVFLFDEQGNTIAWTLSNESGIFEFSGLPYGQYTLTMEKAGFQLSDIPEFVLDENNPNFSNVEIMIKMQDITIDIPENIYVGNNGFIVYPNPVDDELNIKFAKIQKELTIELYTLNGQKVLSKQVSGLSENIRIDVSILKSGIYIGRIKANKQNYFFKILK